MDAADWFKFTRCDADESDDAVIRIRTRCASVNQQQSAGSHFPAESTGKVSGA
jgi:hypothetical protein